MTKAFKRLKRLFRTSHTNSEVDYASVSSDAEPRSDMAYSELMDAIRKRSVLNPKEDSGGEIGAQKELGFSEVR